ncbi:MAG: lipoyl(octanoyl) transferase LipB [Phycisphaeraceae bacterium]|nr:lipoyl(octanoyl) transferase LipB [Phycisphaeraceae bacterium]
MISETIGRRPLVTPNVNPKPPIQVQDQGLVPYEQALTLQRKLNQAVIDGNADPTILLVEHPPVITLTRRAAPNLLADDATLAKLGVATAETDRGGDITYHGPGQLVAYPILKLADFGLNLSSYMRLLERAVIDTVATWGITGHAEYGATGVWVGLNCLAGDAQRPVPNHVAVPSAKICAMGVRIRKNTTMHGLALNVVPDMSHFDLIVPCGLDGRPVTSMKQLLGDQCPTMAQVKDIFTQAIRNGLQNTDRSASCTNGSAPRTTAGS